MWLRVDDRFHASRKVKQIPRGKRMAALGLWISAGSWTAGEPIDGFVPEYMVDDLGGTVEQARALVAAGLWDEMDGGWMFRNWTDYNPDAGSQQAQKDAKSEGAKQGNHRRWHAKRGLFVAGCEFCESDTDSVTDSLLTRGVRDEANPPVPSRPDPTQERDKSLSHPRKRGSRVPLDFVITEDLREWAAREVPLVDVDAKLGQWIDFWAGKAGAEGVKLDWVATWRNGMRKQQEWQQRDHPPQQAKPLKMFKPHEDDL